MNPRIILLLLASEISFAEIWLMSMLMLKCYKRDTARSLKSTAEVVQQNKIRMNLPFQKKEPQ